MYKLDITQDKKSSGISWRIKSLISKLQDLMDLREKQIHACHIADQQLFETEQKISRLRRQLHRHIEQNPQFKSDVAITASVAFSNSQERIVVTDINQVPDHYIHHRRTLNFNAVNKALQNKTAIPGLEFSQS